MSHHRYPRHRRIAKLIQTEIAPALQRYLLEHPELELDSALLTIARVEVTPDLSFARIYVALSEDLQPAEVKARLKQLNQLMPVLRHQLGQVTSMRHLPKMRFQLETNTQKVSNLTQLLATLDC